MSPQVQTWRVGEHVVLGVSGELDHFGVTEVRPALLGLVQWAVG